MADPCTVLDALGAALAALGNAPAGLTRHAGIAGALIAAGELSQGLADAAFHVRNGVDDCDPASDLAQAVTGMVASCLIASWRSGFTSCPLPPPGVLGRLRAALPSGPVAIRTGEGYAYYALYPELYAEAAAAMRPPPRVVGLRSIGTSLAAAAAAGCGAAVPVTLRPCGDPFARELRVAPALAAALTAPSAGGWAVVDEGPGLSGSSFAAVGGFLQAHGAPAAAVAFLPGHGGGPGPEASAATRACWAGTRTLHVPFDDAIAPRLAGWADPLTGPAVAPLQDLSGGRWRDHVPAPLRTAPAWPEQERRKFLLHTETGAVLLKFAGLGAEGDAKLVRARALHGMGLVSEPLGLAHGFLVERWVGGTPLDTNDPAQRTALLDHLVHYLAARTRLPVPEPGAPPDELRTMMRRNLGLAGLHEAAALAATLPAPGPAHAVAIDGRLHAWEWRVCRDGRLLKTDALDHAQAHDLVGAQGLSWDIAGATVEFALSGEEAERLRAAIQREAGRPIDPPRVAFDTLAYLAFQIGWWRMAAGGCEGARAAARCDHYRDLARSWRPGA